MSRNLEDHTWVAGGALFLAGSIALAGCSPQHAHQAAVRTPNATYVGSAACAPCHSAEAAEQLTSRHAHTIHFMSSPQLGKAAPPTGPIPDSDLLVRRVGQNYQVAVRDRPGHPLQLALAFGSGKYGVTYVGLQHRRVLEMRDSFFPSLKRWYITPGHEQSPRDEIARASDKSFSRKCIGCHVVTLPKPGLLPDANMLGVGCESCHGPGSAHIAAVGTASRDLRMPDPRRWTNEQSVARCGRCHGLSFAPGDPQALLTNRFQGYAISLSRCYRESGHGFSCTTCHNPHANASTDMNTYVRVCLSCHSSGRPASRGAPRLCPVNTRSGCIGCHMPSRSAFPAGNMPLKIVDHWIRVPDQAP